MTANITKSVIAAPISGLAALTKATSTALVLSLASEDAACSASFTTLEGICVTFRAVTAAEERNITMERVPDSRFRASASFPPANARTREPPLKRH